MIHRIEIENFYSVMDSQVLDLRARANSIKKDYLGPIFQGSQDCSPKIVAIFGANASGKTTLLRAISFVSWFVQHSFALPPVADQPQPGIGAQPCLRFFSDRAKEMPTRICVHFAGPEDLTTSEDLETNFCRYSYEVRFESYLEFPRTVQSESLRRWPQKSGKSIRVFERDKNGKINDSKEFSLSGYKNVIDKVRSNASLISTLVQFNHKPSLRLKNIASRVFSNLLMERIVFTDEQAINLINASNPSLLESLNSKIQRVDLGIKSMSIEGTPLGLSAFFVHEGLDRAVNIQHESNGTREFIRTYPFLFNALISGGVAVLDELDQSLHPLMLEEIVRWFQSEKTNPHNAQLWMTCQSVSLLENLKKEEIVFCEKKDGGQTKIYSLTDIKGVRTIANFRKEYLGGVYGAVPKIG